MPKYTKKPHTKAVTPEPIVNKKGRPSSEETLKYLWYRDVEGFERCNLKPWWSGIEWGEGIKAKKAKRSPKHRVTAPRTMHAGFLWETIRRLPDFPNLLQDFRRLDGEDLVGRVLLPGELAILGEAQKAFVGFLEEYRVLVVRALRLLRSEWKLCFENLPQNSKDKWEGCYLALWNAVGKPGSVPAAPAELPAKEPLDYWGQGRTAYDLLITPPCSGRLKIYESHPLPSLFLRSFAELLPGKDADVDQRPGFTEGKIDPCTYPWLSFGILEQCLDRYHLHPLALAVDLSKSNEMIVRDLKTIIEEKRRVLGISVADRRIRKESFDKIMALDQGVFGPPETPLLARTVKEFRASAQLNLDNLIYRMRCHMKGDDSAPPDQTVSDEVREFLEQAMLQPSLPGSP